MESGNWDSWNEFINAQHQKYNKSVSSKVAAEQFSHNEGQSGAQNKAKENVRTEVFITSNYQQVKQLQFHDYCKPPHMQKPSSVHRQGNFHP